MNSFYIFLRHAFRGTIALIATATGTALANPLEPTRATASPLTLEAAILTARENHPAVRAARSRVDGARARVDREGAWADPMAEIAFMREDTLRPFTVRTVEYMISQELPLSQRNKLAARSAGFEAEAMMADVRATELQVGARAATSYLSVARTQRQFEIVAREKRLLDDAISVARIRFESGKETQNTVLSAQTERIRLEERELVLRNNLNAAEAALNEAMGLEPSSPVGPVSLPKIIPSLPTLSAIQSLALRGNPDVSAIDSEIDAREADTEIARKAWRPDPTVRLTLRQAGGRGPWLDEYNTALSISLPWLNPKRTRSAIREADHALDASEAQRAAIANSVSAEVVRLWSRIRVAVDQLALFNDRLLPLARHALENTRLAYENERAAFLELIDARRTLEQVESAAVDALADLHTARAELEAVAGGSLETP